jgi:hypothetical protein
MYCAQCNVNPVMRDISTSEREELASDPRTRLESAKNTSRRCRDLKRRDPQSISLEHPEVRRALCGGLYRSILNRGMSALASQATQREMLSRTIDLLRRNTSRRLRRIVPFVKLPLSQSDSELREQFLGTSDEQ